MEEETNRGRGLCPVEMWLGGLCGRPMHEAPDHDSKQVCLMHSHDPNKSEEEFWAEFNRILARAKKENGGADFSGFRFPPDYAGGDLEVDCYFNSAEFTGDAGFDTATFTEDANFDRATFAGYANFDGATFTGNAIFNRATFSGRASFDTATFTGDANFNRATFSGNVSFYEPKFIADASFDNATFTGDASFYDAAFMGGASFDKATFTGYASFHAPTFTRGASFNEATFEKDASFDFATFMEDASFEETEFALLVSFGHARFLQGARFREAHLRHDETLEAGLQFVDVRLEHPERIEFYKTYLGQALFYNTDVSKVDFTLVEWRKRGSRSSLFEEAVFIDEADFYDLDDLDSVPGSEDQLSLGLIAETYQQLKRNYDAKGDYWTAGHFHYGEMEMLRLHSRFRWKPLRWLERNLGLTALYKHGSAYGESMSRPLAWLVAMVLLFALLFPLAGLTVNPNQGDVGLAGWQVDYWNAGTYFQQHAEENPIPRWVRWVTRDHAAVPLLVHSGMTALSVAGFQKELRYSPAYPWGRAMALLELLLTTTLGGLFLLAIRRQYKRS